MEMETATWAAAIFGVLLAGISKGGFGAGVGFLATPLIALTIPPSQALAIMLPILILMDVVNVKSYWRQWDSAAARPIIIYGALGIFCAALIFSFVDANMLRFALGLIAILFAISQWIGPPRATSGPIIAAILGWTTGFISTIAHAGGPPVTMHLLGQKLDKLTYQATSVIIFWAINLMKVPAFMALGLVHANGLSTSLVLAPVAIIGVGLGVWAHKRVPAGPFFRIMTAALFFTGIKLAWDGLSAWI
ncbi:MAG: sulfite exporter TauE/SafE family protein [Pikeienuella sp.]